MLTPDDIDPAGCHQFGQPLAFGRKKSGLADIGFPGLDVVLGMGDIPVAAQQSVSAVGGEVRHPLGQRGHEPFLLQLPVGVGFAGVYIDTRHRHAIRQVDLDIAAVLSEFGCRQTDPDVGEWCAAENRDTAAAFQVWLRRSQVPAGLQRRRQGIGYLVVIGAGLLQTHHIGGSVFQPGQQTEILRRALPHCSAHAVDVDGRDDQSRALSRASAIVFRYCSLVSYG